jgi:hypothetical protein
MMKWNQNDGGRVAAGFEPTDGACVYRAIAIVTEEPYKEVHDELLKLSLEDNPKHKGSGVEFHVLDKYMEERGWKWKDMRRKTPPKSELMPKETIAALATNHLVACIDGVFQDTHDFTAGQGAQRMIEGYYRKK